MARIGPDAAEQMAREQARAFWSKVDGKSEPRRRRARAVVSSVDRDDSGRATRAVATIDKAVDQPILIDHGQDINVGDVFTVQNQGTESVPRWGTVRRIFSAAPAPGASLPAFPAPTGLTLLSGTSIGGPGVPFWAWIYASWDSLNSSVFGGAMSYDLQYATNAEITSPNTRQVAWQEPVTTLAFDIEAGETNIPRVAVQEPDDFAYMGRIRIEGEVIEYTAHTSGAGDGGSECETQNGQLVDSSKQWALDTWVNYILRDSYGALFRITGNDQGVLYIENNEKPAAGPYSINPGFTGCIRGEDDTDDVAHDQFTGVGCLSVGTMLAPLAPGLYYQVRVRARRHDGAVSGWGSWQSITTELDTTPPPTPTNFRVTGTPGGARLSWDGPTKMDVPDLAGFYIWESVTGTLDDAIYVGMVGTRTQTIYSPLAIGGFRYYALQSVDTSENTSLLTDFIGVKTHSPIGRNLLPNADFWISAAGLGTYSTPSYYETLGGNMAWARYDSLGPNAAPSLSYRLPGMSSVPGEARLMFPILGDESPWLIRTEKNIPLVFSFYMRTLDHEWDDVSWQEDEGDTGMLNVRLVSFLHDGTEEALFNLDALQLPYTSEPDFWSDAGESWRRVQFRIEGRSDPGDIGRGMEYFLYYGFQLVFENWGDDETEVTFTKLQLEVGTVATDWSHSSYLPPGADALRIGPTGIVGSHFYLDSQGRVSSAMVPAQDGIFDLGSPGLTFGTIRCQTIIAENIEDLSGEGHPPVTLTGAAVDLLEISGGQVLGFKDQLPGRVLATPTDSGTPSFQPLQAGHAYIGTPDTLELGATPAEGSSTSFVRSDHVHGVPSSSAPSTAAKLVATDENGAITIVDVTVTGEFEVSGVLQVSVSEGSVGIGTVPDSGTALLIVPDSGSAKGVVIQKNAAGSGDLWQILDDDGSVFWQVDQDGNLETGNYVEGHTGARATPDGSFYIQDLFARGSFTAASFVHKTISVDSGHLLVADGGRSALESTTPAGEELARQVPIARFDADVKSGEPPFTVQFESKVVQDLAGNPVTGHYWDLNGNGEWDSFEENPEYEYGTDMAEQDVDVRYQVETAVGDESIDETPGFIEVGEYIPPPPPIDERVTDQLLGLWTFEDASGSIVQDRSSVQNQLDLTIASPENTTWVENGLRIDTATKVQSSGDATHLVAALKTAGAITVETFIQADSSILTSGILRRIFCLADSQAVVGAVLHSDEDWFEVRVQTDGTGIDPDGTPDIETQPGSMTGQMQHVVYTRDASGNEQIIIDKTVAASGTRGGDFDPWTDMPLIIANEPGGARGWLGLYKLVAIYGKVLSADEIEQNFDAGPDYTTGGVDPNTPTISSFYASPDNIDKGDSTTLYWSVTNADSLYITPDVGDVTGLTQIGISPASDTTYTLEATNEEGSSSAAESVTVDDGGIIPPIPTGLVRHTLFFDGKKDWVPNKFVSPSGAYGNSGNSTSEPWSLEAANDKAVAGDVVAITRGTYDHYLAPQNDGVKDGTNVSPIVFMDYNGDVLIRGDGSSEMLCYLRLKHYILVEGLDFECRDSGSWNWLHATSAEWVTVRGCTFYSNMSPSQIHNNSNWRHRAAVLTGSEYTHLDNCTFRNYWSGPSWGGNSRFTLATNCYFLNAARHNATFNAGWKSGSSVYKASHMFYRCVFDYAYDADNMQWVGVTGVDTDYCRYRGVVYRDCVFMRGGENSLDMKDSREVTIEGCVFAGTIGSTTGWWDLDDSFFATISVGQGSYTEHALVRFSTFIDTCQPLVWRKGWHFYNNTLIGCNRTAFGWNKTVTKPTQILGTCGFRQKESGLVQRFVNNLIVGQNGIEASVKDITQNTGVELDYNMYWDNESSGYSFAFAADGWSPVGWAAWKAGLTSRNVTGAEAHSVYDRDPDFLDCPERPNYENQPINTLDFRISEGSRARGAGGPIDLAQNSGTNSRTLEVRYPEAFSDGHEIAWGDILVLNGVAIQVDEVDYANDVLKLVEPATWTQGQKIYYYYDGDQPDIGAKGPNDDDWWKNVNI